MGLSFFILHRFRRVAPGTHVAGSIKSCTGLNGQLGHLIRVREGDEHNYSENLFFRWLPVENPADFGPWLDAYREETEVTVDFVVRPLVNPSKRFMSGQMHLFCEQGTGAHVSFMEGQSRGYAALHALQVGNKLTIFNPSGTRKIWQGTMTKRRLLNLASYGGKPNAETKFLKSAAVKELPAVIELATPKD